jgi:arginine/lysine/ornithine decarboxylase
MNQFETALKKCGSNACIYITSPDYTGRTADIKSIAELCGRYGAKLIVDNAHGSHLAFFEENIHPIHLGADMCCDSAHKMLPALTGAAVLHAKSVGCENILKENMSIFASTSPSYLIMESLDLCCRFIDEDIRRCIRENVGYIHDFREHFSDRLVFGEGEPFHITIRAAESGLSGKELADNLRQCGAECEYSDDELVILLMSPINVEGDYIRLTEITENAVSLCEKRKNSLPESLYLPEPICKMSIREAVFSPSEEIPVTAAEGRICGAVKVPCPPAVPIAVSGEVITAEHINIFKRYGIFTVNVVK